MIIIIVSFTRVIVIIIIVSFTRVIVIIIIVSFTRVMKTRPGADIIDRNDRLCDRNY